MVNGISVVVVWTELELMLDGFVVLEPSGVDEDVAVVKDGS